MEKTKLEIKENRPLTASVYQLVLAGDCRAITAPGQFVNIKLDGLFLRRPLSVCDSTADSVTLLYKVVGRGTKQLSAMKNGSLDVLVGLGNGYEVARAGKRPLLIGGGVGVPPLYKLAKELRRTGCEVTVILGFNTADEVFYEEEFRALGATVLVTTVDGSKGIKGFVTEAMKQVDYTYFYGCGPEPMLRAVFAQSSTDGELSFEERMGCGFGACMGCSCETIAGAKRICKDGPVLKKGELLWKI